MENSLKEIILSCEKQLFRSEERKEAGVIENLIGEEFVEFGESGRKYNKEDTVKAVIEPSGLKINIENYNLLELSDKAVLATYTAVKTSPDEKGSSRSFRSSVWKLNDGKWQIVFHQGTKI